MGSFCLNNECDHNNSILKECEAPREIREKCEYLNQVTNFCFNCPRDEKKIRIQDGDLILPTKEELDEWIDECLTGQDVGGYGDNEYPMVTFLKELRTLITKDAKKDEEADQ